MKPQLCFFFKKPSLVYERCNFRFNACQSQKSRTWNCLLKNIRKYVIQYDNLNQEPKIMIHNYIKYWEIAAKGNLCCEYGDPMCGHTSFSCLYIFITFPTSL